MKTIFDILRGVVIGLANIIPGVSGGTMMVSMGIYDTIIGCINSLFKDFKRCVKMLWPYALGMVLGILGLAKLITFLLGSYPLPTNMAFIGLKIIDGDNSADASITLGLGQMIILFMMGVIAAATMVIPGVSGSMMLMLLGYYNPVVGSVSGLVDALLSGNMSAVLRCCGVLIPFGIGVVVGIFAVAKLIEILLRRFPGPTYCAIMGLVTASPVAILMGLSYTGLTAAAVIFSVVMLALGSVVAYKLGGE